MRNISWVLVCHPVLDKHHYRSHDREESQFGGQVVDFMNRFKYLIYGNKELTTIYNQLKLLLIGDRIAYIRSFRDH